MTELRKCVWCHGTDTVGIYHRKGHLERWAVVCRNCHRRGGKFVSPRAVAYGITRNSAIRKWNGFCKKE